MEETPKKVQAINLSFKQKYAERMGQSPSTTPKNSQQNLSKEEQIKIILKKNSNERNTQDIILLSSQIENVNFLKQFIGTKSVEFLEMCKFLEVEEYDEEYILFNQGDIGEKFFIILDGQVSVIINVKNKKGETEKKEVGKLKPGASFGDLALLFNSIRNATIKLDKKSTFIVLRKEIFQKYIKYKTPPNAHEILKFYDQYVLTPYQLDLPEKIQILSKTEQTNYISNSLIIRQGQLIQSLYFIKKGVVKVNRIIKFKIHPLTGQLLPLDYSDPTPQEIASKQYKEISLEIDEICKFLLNKTNPNVKFKSIILDEGSYFADYELFKQIKSSVSIVAYTPCEIVQIQKEDMVVLPIKMQQDLLNSIKPYPDDYKLRRKYLEGLQWQKYKNVLVEGVCKENILRKKLQNSVNFFSRSKLIQMPHQPDLICFDDSFTHDPVQGDVQQIENKFFGQYNQQFGKRRSIQIVASPRLAQKNKNQQLSVQIQKSLLTHKNKVKKDINDNEHQQLKQKGDGEEFLEQSGKNSFYIQDENDFLKFDEELQEIDIEDEAQQKKSILSQLMKQLDPFNRNTISQKKYQPNQKKQNGKSLTITIGKQAYDSINNKPNTYSSKIGNLTSKVQSTSQQLFRSNKVAYKSQRQILPKITSQIQYSSNYQDIICQVTQKQINQFKTNKQEGYQI